MGYGWKLFRFLREFLGFQEKLHKEVNWGQRGRFRMKKFVQPRQVLLEQIAVNNDGVTIAADEQEQLGARRIRLVVLVNPSHGVVDDVEIEQKAMLHASLFLECLKIFG